MRHELLIFIECYFVTLLVPDKDRIDNLFHGTLLGAEATIVSDASDLLLSQALTLDGIFTETARRAAGNMAAGYLPAFEIYMRLAMKAQSQSRATLEALAKLHQPREQTVRHVHVNEGGQAIVADEFHSHTGGQGNAQSSEQPHAITAGGTGASASLSSPDAGRFTVPVASRERKEAVPNARRQGKRRAQGE